MILFLGNTNSPIYALLKDNKYRVINLQSRISPDIIKDNHITSLVSHGYRYIIDPETLSSVEGVKINCHISMLPWNRGADPNAWSWIDETPKGVTIHEISPGLDKGDIILQKQVEFKGPDWTLSTTYNRLQDEICLLFSRHLHNLLAGNISASKQIGEGSYHHSKEFAEIFAKLPLGWHTPVSDLIKYAKETMAAQEAQT